jgi:PKD repeat protein
LVWEVDSGYDCAEERQQYYLATGLPSIKFNGTLDFGYSDDLDNYYENKYNECLEIYSPVKIYSSMNEEGNNIVINTEIDIRTKLDTLMKKIYIGVTTREDSLEFGLVEACENFEFTQIEVGETASYSATFPKQNNWNIDDIVGFAFIQYYDTKEMIQAKEIFHTAELKAEFTANVQSGPGDLTVRFDNYAFPELNADSFAWDLDGDGNVDSSDRDPVFTYTDEGSYNVSLTVTIDGESLTETKENFITVTNNNEVAGIVSGTWKAENSPYTITDEIVIPKEASLTIEPGTTIEIASGSILVNGQICAEGTNENPIIFRGEGFSGLKVNNTVTANKIAFCQFYNSDNSALKIDNAMFEISNCVFYGNTGASGAGAIQISNCPDFLVEKCLISGNNNQSFTGGIGVLSSIGTIRNCVLTNNAGNASGAIAIKENSVVEVENCTIANNAGSSQFFIHGSEILMQNSIVAFEGNLFTNISSDIEVNYCCLSSDYNGTGNITDNPDFVLATDDSELESANLSANWNVSENSPCIDAGNPDSEYNDVADPENPSTPLFPAQGTFTNDIGATGGNVFSEDFTTDLTINLTSDQDLTDAIISMTSVYGENVEIDYSGDEVINIERLFTSVYEFKLEIGENVFTSEVDLFTSNEFSFEVTFSSNENIVESEKVNLINYPNPFKVNSGRNTGTTISYSLPNSEDISIAIYNVKGQIIKDFVEGRKMKGKHKVFWNGQNNLGKRVSSGIYYYQLKSGEMVLKSGKCILLK